MQTLTQNPKSKIQTWLVLGALALLALALALKVAQSAGIMAGLFAWPYQLDESEGMIVAETLLLDSGKNIYDPVTPQLFIAAPYPPLFYLLNWPVLHFVGVSFKVGRALSLLATVGAAAAIFAIVRRVSGDGAAGVVAAGVWGALGVVAFWGALVKPDVFALACGLGGLWWLLARPPAQVWAALPFFWAAIYSKQTALAAAGAACLWLLLTRPRTGVGFTAATLAGAFLPAALLNVLTHGGYYYHIVTVHELPWFAERFISYARDFLGSYWPWVGVGMAGILGALAFDLWGWVRRRNRPAPEAGARAAPHAPILLAAYLALSLVAATGVGTLGGNHNHLLEWAAAGCLGFGLVIAGLRRLPGLAGAGVAAAVFVVLALQVGDLYRTPGWMGYELRVPPASVAEGWRNVTQYVTNDPGAAYSDNVGLLLNARKRLWSTDPFTQTHATFFGRWDESALVAAIRRQAFSLVVLRVDVFAGPPPAAGVPCAAQTSDQGDVSPCIQDAVRTAYVLDQRNVEFIYKPRQ